MFLTDVDDVLHGMKLDWIDQTGFPHAGAGGHKEIKTPNQIYLYSEQEYVFHTLSLHSGKSWFPPAISVIPYPFTGRRHYPIFLIAFPFKDVAQIQWQVRARLCIMRAYARTMIGNG